MTANHTPTIMVVNPNTTQSMTDAVVEAARRIARPGTKIQGSTAKSGVASVESNADETWAAAAVMEQIAAGERPDATYSGIDGHDTKSRGIDGYVIACFGDTGAAAAKELASGPVVGMTEAALMTAALISARFAIVTMPRRTLEQSRRVVRGLGLEHRCTIRAVDVPVADVAHGAIQLVELFLAEAQLALKADDAEAVILGCAGLTELVEPLERRLGVPVIDGVLAGVTMVEGLLAQGLSTSRKNTYGPTA